MLSLFCFCVVQVWNYKLRRCLFTLLGHLDYIRTTFFHHVSSSCAYPSDGCLLPLCVKRNLFCFPGWESLLKKLCWTCWYEGAPDVVAFCRGVRGINSASKILNEI